MKRRIVDGRTRHIVVISPHFDDVPLSLGESLRSGVMRRHRVRVATVFGRTNWTSLVHPTPARASVVSRWRRIEETMASVLFRYRWSAGDWSEVVLRTGDLDSRSFLDPDVDLTDEPFVGQIEEWIRALVATSTDPSGRSSDPGRRDRLADGEPVHGVDLILAPVGLGGHVDHMIIAEAAGRALQWSPVPIGFYEDRPYRAYVTDDEVRTQIERLIGTADRVTVSGLVRPSTQKRVRMCYPSQMTPYFRDAMQLDREAAATESVWFPVGQRPSWFKMPS